MLNYLTWAELTDVIVFFAKQKVPGDLIPGTFCFLLRLTMKS
jgi:hypothetical protein